MGLSNMRNCVLYEVSREVFSLQRYIFKLPLYILCKIFYGDFFFACSITESFRTAIKTLLCLPYNPNSQKNRNEIAEVPVSKEFPQISSSIN